MIDWQQLILDMNGLGISCVGIAKRTGAAENTIRGLKGGYWNEPRYSLGAKLLDSKHVALTRLIEAARAVDDGAVVVDKDTCEVPLEDMQELRAALKGWGQ